MVPNNLKVVVMALLAVGALGTLGSAFHNLQARVEQPAASRAEPPKDAKRTPAYPVKPKTDTEKLQGIWEVIETRADGETRPMPEGLTGHLVIDGDRFRLMLLPYAGYS
jgi:hypothetical protein